ncbi:MAG: heme b synthase [Deltaproteobacteria bacterium]|nr:heme b synthase [Deltaproteobacteria bacterium]MBW1978116.1 heme b synthase [Deltaproteobacteria bacterium]MBW2044806.1 heme b synthase [Deltaproteobacteria bacterium]MBW2301627.1 heme b synthase [Deltaproteobacteria bacterium]
MENKKLTDNVPRLVAWEITRRCNLNCIHCRAAAERGPYPGELSSETCFNILEQISNLAKPIIILTGGEPLLREDIFEISLRGTRLGFRMVMATNGTLITPEVAKDMKASGIKRVSVSIDGASAAQHDEFRQVPGAFKGALEGIELLKKENIEFQLNTTITKHNLGQIEEILNLAIELGAVAHHIFLLVPTGRAREMADQEIDAGQYEKLLHWFYEAGKKAPIHLKATCAPHYYRILRQEAHKRGERVDFNTYGLDAVTRGCLGGISFCFISYDGVVQPCGYLEVKSGDLKKSSFESVWKNSEVFRKLRDFSSYEGKCGRCEYLRVCGGCRARAYENTGNYLAEEPLCLYNPTREEFHGRH